MSLRSLSTTGTCFGGVKMSRRKQKMRADHPHLPEKKEKTAKTLAIDNFDFYYPQFYGSRWPSMRLGLLSRPKHCAVVNNFGDPEITIEMLSELGCVDVNARFHQSNKQRLSKLEKRKELFMSNDICDSGLKITGDANVNHHEQLEESDGSREGFSLSKDSVSGRFIDPDERVIGDVSTSMYDYIPTSTLKGMEDFIEETDLYKQTVQSAKPSLDSSTVSGSRFATKDWFNIHFPKHLRVFVFPRNVLDRFPAPKPGPSGNFNYYCLDGASLLPVLALDIRPGQDVLDLCSGPGGKALLSLQTLYPRTLVCNDISSKRLDRVGSVMEQFCGVGSGMGGVRDTVSFSRSAGTDLMDYGVYDRVLCDVPCFADRHSVVSDDQNIFAPKLARRRLEQAEEQCNLLKAGLTYLKPGGSLVYATCTLSPVQNEGVVNMALTQLWQESSHQYVVDNLDDALKPFSFMYRILGRRTGVKLGNVVIPWLSNNFGPMYFCKISRQS